jgi:hypothetical protein
MPAAGRTFPLRRVGEALQEFTDLLTFLTSVFIGWHKIGLLSTLSALGLALVRFHKFSHLDTAGPDENLTVKIALLEHLEDISRQALGDLFLEDSLVKIRIEL